MESEGSERRTGREPTVAILMDFENARDADLHRILAEAAAFGRVIVRRAYADWTRYAHARNQLREAGFEEVHQFATGANAKNATDIHLTVDAMDVLYTRPVDVFLLITADSDFAKLARRLREGGKKVVGMGAKARVGRALVQSCDQYIYYDTDARVLQVPRKQGRRPDKESVAKERVEITELHRIVLEAMPAAADESGRVYGGPLSQSIRRIRPDFSYQDYGFSSFLRCIESLDPMIETEHDPNASDFRVWITPAYEELANDIRQDARAVKKEKEEKEEKKSSKSSGSSKKSSRSSKNGGRSRGGNGDGLTLATDVQKRFHDAWEDGAKNGKLQGSRAARVVTNEYGVSRLAETPLNNLQGVLDAAPHLAKRWRRDGAMLYRK